MTTLQRVVVSAGLIAGLSLSPLCQARLIYDFAGQNLLLDTRTGLIWIPPTADATELQALSAYGQNLRIAGRQDVLDLAANSPLYLDSFLALSERPFDPAVLSFFEFAASGSLPPFPVDCAIVPAQACVFGWAVDGPAGNPPLSSYTFIGFDFLYDSLADPLAPYEVWNVGFEHTLGAYPIDPCDTTFLGICSMATFRIMDPVDSDSDGVMDDVDNCVNTPNLSQIDTDGDNFGNHCDPDLNNDGTVDFFDLGLLKSVFFSSDADADFDASGLVDFLDLGILKQRFFAAPGPSSLPPPVTYSADAQPVLASRCAPCHTAQHPLFPIPFATNYADVLQAASHPACAGQVVGECALTLIETGAKPYNICTGDPVLDLANVECLRPGELQLVRDWVSQGLPE